MRKYFTARQKHEIEAACAQHSKNLRTNSFGRYIVDDIPKRVRAVRYKRKLDGMVIAKEEIKSGDYKKAFDDWMVRRFEFKNKIMAGKDA